MFIGIVDPFKEQGYDFAHILYFYCIVFSFHSSHFNSLPLACLMFSLLYFSSFLTTKLNLITCGLSASWLPVQMSLSTVPRLVSNSWTQVSLSPVPSKCWYYRQVPTTQILPPPFLLIFLLLPLLFPSFFFFYMLGTEPSASCMVGEGPFLTCKYRCLQ